MKGQSNPMKDSDDKQKGLTPRQQRKALEWLDEVMRGKRSVAVFRATKDGALQECVGEEFVERNTTTNS